MAANKICDCVHFEKIANEILRERERQRERERDRQTERENHTHACINFTIY